MLKEKLELISCALHQHCKMETDWYEVPTSLRLQTWFTLKYILCVLLNRRYKKQHWQTDYVCVAMLDYYPTYSWDDGAGANWTTLCVLHDHTQWGYFEMSDGYP